ncbi:2-succinyl-5-enolpyruvyl-6-hydroxy-3-cyclohexene-1-carboxylic-acid synthase [Corynebacterium yudongzhengii]|uniref:2-succinyl-5-enolpyruvyl-6-hydroxy-3-cyclohexene-1-carboxylate synthase n=1 Tax=Corynebacterium yudongzhengii TaxID=2080740 RepID=A0A2U1T9P2_9CORY|nr:2-succinyl-5-enolpyruvyl-6-hydroxy-3-cyclohexene-1-carboxylic-acid synthase [Corynebacterium yudongzhengii]AWB81188.1 2-succinyl-5-enolpyruvyl-6-hydroxy-3-cyclohexene-1-carboxylic-acid synthase [Corynebacterium yudongzhengii]PWC02727.1 2-succinyl-5-enolpyruvyl-6-hydroxy-3-cyclohexene-1-carboxylic-acid synthase [Corynebacterium yudongzhengii]
MSESLSSSAHQPEAMQLAQQLAERLSRHISDVVVCPGSRNVPLSLALLAQPGIRVHTRIDERSAAFLALGMSRVSGRHTAVVTTSGTAVANCLPAMVEAQHSHTPLLMLSADRPRRLVGTGASQTIEQQGIFSTVTDTVQIAAEEDVPRLSHALSSQFAVHVNVSLDAPLVGDQLPVAHATDAAPREPLDLWKDHGCVDVDLSRNTLVIAGDEAWEVAGLEDVPTIAEPSTPAPFHPVHPLAAGLFARGEITTDGSSEYADYVAKTKPEQIIVVGHPTLHRPVLGLLTDPDIEVIILSRTDQFTDPAKTGRHFGTRVKVSGRPRKQWLSTCRGLSEVAAEAVRSVLADDTHGFTGLHVAAALTDGLGVGDAVVLGASNPVRDASLTGLPFGGVDTYAPRGAAGIDGTVSQAIGVALATQTLNPEAVRAPHTLALLGDVTFLHDIGGLLIGPDQPAPENLTLVVANDSGGGIFESLEIGRPQLRASFEPAVGSPHEADIASLCAGYGVGHVRVETLNDLLVALADAAEYPYGIRVIEAATTRSTRRALDAALKDAVGV